MIKQGKHRRNLFLGPISILLHTFAVCSPSYQHSRIFSTKSKSSRSIPAIIKTVCTVSKIYTTSLDINTNTNHKIGTPISLRCIGQFPIDCQAQQRELAATDQVVINEWFDNNGITIGNMADTVEKQNLSKRLLYT